MPFVIRQPRFHILDIFLIFIPISAACYYLNAQPVLTFIVTAADITGMPNYFSDYDTEVNFISREQMAKEHSAYPHGGFVMTSGETGGKNKQIIEYRCQLASNPEFTGSVLLACARAAYRLKEAGHKGAYTMLDIPPAFYSSHSGETLRSKYT
jgi:diaminopimelate dehydrogenase